MTQDELLVELFAAIDDMDTERFVRFLTEDAVFRFGSAPAAAGREEIRQAVSAFFDSIAGLRHRLHQALSEGETLVCEGEATYTRHDTSEITLPFVNVFEFDDGLIARYKIYSDIGPLFAP